MGAHQKLPQTEAEARAQTLQGQVKALGEAFREVGRQYEIAVRPVIAALIRVDEIRRALEPPRRWWEFWRAR